LQHSNFRLKPSFKPPATNARPAKEKPVAVLAQPALGLPQPYAIKACPKKDSSLWQ
jgi:hypothetical protein